MASGAVDSIEAAGRLTLRQMRLFYGASVQRSNRLRAQRIGDMNAAFNGGKEAEQLVRKLLNHA